MSVEDIETEKEKTEIEGHVELDNVIDFAIHRAKEIVIVIVIEKIEVGSAVVAVINIGVGTVRRIEMEKEKGIEIKMVGMVLDLEMDIEDTEVVTSH